MGQWIYGKNNVLERLRQRKPIEQLCVTRKEADLVALAKKNKIEVQVISLAEANRLCKGNHQGYLAKIGDYQTISLDQLLSNLDMTTNPILVLCDQLEDPHNLGAILRTCDGVGVQGVILGKNRSVGLTPTVAKVSTGAIDTVPISLVTNLVAALKTCKDHGFWVVGADNTEAVDYRSVPSDRPLVVVVGSEGKGISPLVKKECDYRVKIFMQGALNSLNVSVATGVLLYSIMEKRVPLIDA